MAEDLFNFDEIKSTGSPSTSEDLFNFAELEEPDAKLLEDVPSRSGMSPEFSSDQELEQRLQRRKFEVEQSRKAMESGEIGFLEGETQILGKGGAGALFDYMGNEIGQAGKGLFSLLPNDIQDDVKLQAASAWDAMAKSNFGKVVDYYVDKGAEVLDDLEKSDPQSY